MMNTVTLEMLRKDCDGVATYLNEHGGKLLLEGSEEVFHGGVFVYGTSTARLFGALMEDCEIQPDLWCTPPSELTSLREVVRTVLTWHCLVVGINQEEIYLVLLDKEAAERQDEWHNQLVASLKSFLTE